MSASKLRDVRKLADSRAVFEFDFPVAGLPGLPTQLLFGDAGQVHARLSFGREQGFPVAHVTLQAQVAMICQRCLAAVTLPLETQSAVLVVESQQEAEAVPAGWETFFAPEGRLTFEALVAEELLLALPIVPLHEKLDDCPVPAGAAPAAARAAASEPAEATTRPFAELRALLEERAKHQ